MRQRNAESPSVVLIPFMSELEKKSHMKSNIRIFFLTAIWVYRAKDMVQSMAIVYIGCLASHLDSQQADELPSATNTCSALQAFRNNTKDLSISNGWTIQCSMSHVNDRKGVASVWIVSHFEGELCDFHSKRWGSQLVLGEPWSTRTFLSFGERRVSTGVWTWIRTTLGLYVSDSIRCWVAIQTTPISWCLVPKHSALWRRACHHLHWGLIL